MPVKITSLEAENVKRIKAVQIEPAATGLTVIGGNNGQGKTSVLDAIAWALGGEKYRPAAAQREGANTPPRLQITLSRAAVPASNCSTSSWSSLRWICPGSWQPATRTKPTPC